MIEAQESGLICTKCQSPVTEGDRFCRNCGAIFSDDVLCRHHPSVAAEGVCVICSRASCKECGGESNGTFLCDEHWEYELHEGMARVYGCFDNVQAQYVTRCLEQAGFHPFLYSRQCNPGAGFYSTMVRAGIRNFGKYPIVEMKVLVPLGEVLKAERTLNELGIEEEQPPS